MDQFNEQLSELDTRLRKGLSLGKDLKLEHRIRDSAASMGRCATDRQTDMLDLKTELVTLKNKLFTQDSQSGEQMSAKNQQILKLEAQVKSEIIKRTTRETKIQELERDIEVLLQQYADENELLKAQLAQKDQGTVPDGALLSILGKEDPVGALKQLVEREQSHK